MIFKLFRKDTKKEQIAALLYDAIVARSRQPVFYLDYKVEDSINGRFEMIVLHAYVVFHFLRNEDGNAKDVGQAVFNRFFRDMDDSLREIGVGDLSVPKKIKKMAQSFYGRVEAYDIAREESLEALASALSRNIYPDEPQSRPEANILAQYVLDNEEALKAQAIESFLKGTITFAEIPHVEQKVEQIAN
ncbi:ubiquinol-cytochrome C chaperone family protein [Cohaesibacter celericrescens]|uniref:Ubiquinol-cytochrome C chaperone n=1 Tax=Cohaesibacter celericrescens TaxID=2067669 RepID=A0A2N5XQB1_9HYPH|nr:ubiquinol-cytochrome C chaperone family protein [Cohaesibacter celericrescens]PLW76709.1 ubiquinol-cytochrome C chaperone [Cohaesibacter celericrescens]